MKQQKEFCATLQGKGKTIIVNVAVVLFEEDKRQIVYCPALDIFGYGLTEAEAKESFDICLEEFFDYTINKKTLYAVLEEMGWKIRKGARQKFTPPQFSQLLSQNQVFSDIFDHHNLTKVDRQISIPTCA